MQPLIERSKQDSPSKASKYDHELGLQLLQTHRDEQAQGEYNLLCAKFSRWPYKLYQFWLILSFTIALTAEYFLLETIWGFIKDRAYVQAIMFFLGYIAAALGFLLFLYGCGQMFYAIKLKKPKSAQQSFIKFQYSMIICTIGMLLIIWIVEFGAYFWQSEGLFIFCALAIIPASHLAGGFAVTRVFRESQALARENTCDASQSSEEVNPLLKDFLRQNETIEAEVLKYDEQLNRFGVRVYKCWLKFVAILEIIRLCGYVLFVVTTLMRNRENVPGLKYAIIALFLSSLLCLYSCFKMENALGKKFVRNSERAVLALKACLAVSIISFFLLATSLFSEEETVLEIFAAVGGILFAYCVLIPVLTLVGAVKIHKIIKERDHFAKFSSMTDTSSHL